MKGSFLNKIGINLKQHFKKSLHKVKKNEIPNTEELLKISNVDNSINEVSNNLIREKVLTNVNQLVDISDENCFSASTILQNIGSIFDDTSVEVEKMEQMVTYSNDIKNNIENISNSSLKSLNTCKIFKNELDDGNDSMQKMTSQMDQLGKSITNLYDIIKNFMASSQSIETFIELINRITSQITLLSLNAAIEAAHAGEHGRGFSIVADEIKKLAEQSRNASKEISNVIKDIQMKALESSEKVDVVKNELNLETKILNDVQTKFKEMLIFMEDVINNSSSVSSDTKQILNICNNFLEFSNSIYEIVKNTHENCQCISGISSEQTILADEIKRLSNRIKELM